MGSDIYSADWTEQTYQELARRADALLGQGRRVLVDASFRRDQRRRQFFDLARRLSVPALVLECRADPAVVRSRLQQRHGDASDADWAVYQLTAGEWEPASHPVSKRHHLVDSGAALATALRQAEAILRHAGLL